MSTPTFDTKLLPTILIIDDQLSDQLRLQIILDKNFNKNEIKVLVALSIEEAESLLLEHQVHVVLLDKNIDKNKDETQKNGVHFIPTLLQIQPHLEILVITGSGNFDDVKEALKFGASDFISKDSSNELLIARIKKTIRYAQTSLENKQNNRSTSSFPIELGGSSKIFRQILAQTEILAETERPILLLGSSGTGKSEIAKWIHCCRENFLDQKNKPFFSLNIATLSSEVLESELFGHEKGAFTDALNAKQGFFEIAQNGTLFLDEIGEASLDLQTKLLTVIETGEFFRVGGNRKLKSNAKVIFATNRDLEKMVKAGQFRLDLFMRINSFPVIMPDLEDRKEDIPEIIKALLPKVSQQNNVKVTYSDIPKDFIEHLMTQKIEGNIRGIVHQLDRLLVLSPRDENRKPLLNQWRSIPGLYFKSNKQIQYNQNLKNTPITLQEIQERSFDVVGPTFPGMKELISTLKDKIIQDAFLKNNGELKNTAQSLKVAISYIYPLMKRQSKLLNEISIK